MEDNDQQSYLSVTDQPLFTIFFQSQLEEEVQSPLGQIKQLESVEKGKKQVSYDYNNCQIQEAEINLKSKSENQFTAKQRYLYSKYTNIVPKKLSYKAYRRKGNLQSYKTNVRQIKDQVQMQVQNKLLKRKQNQEMPLIKTFLREYQKAQCKIEEMQQLKINKSEACQHSRKQNIYQSQLKEKENDIPEHAFEIDSKDLGWSNLIFSNLKNVEQNQNEDRANEQIKPQIRNFILKNLDLFTYLVLFLLYISCMATIKNKSEK